MYGKAPAGSRPPAMVRDREVAGGGGLLASAGLLAGADPPVAVSCGPPALLLGAGVAADAVGDAGEGVVVALPRAHPRLRHAMVVCTQAQNQYTKAHPSVHQWPAGG